MFKDERIAKFEIDTVQIDDQGKRSLLYRLFSYMIILRAESLLYKNAVEYYAISPLFEVHRQGEIVPHYDIFFDKGQIRAVRKDGEKPKRLMTLDPLSEG